MANIAWPETLPSDPLLDGFSKNPQSNVIRTAMDAGPQKARRRYTARTVKFSCKMIVDSAELLFFEQFYHTALADGVLRFNFTDPVSREAAEFRFTADYTAAALDGLFEVSMQLEKL